jgi:hypothetical protein
MRVFFYLFATSWNIVRFIYGCMYVVGFKCVDKAYMNNARAAALTLKRKCA